MTTREMSRQGFERIGSLLREQWIQLDDWGGETGQRIWDVLLVAWAWAGRRPVLLRWTITLGSVLLSVVVGLILRQSAPAPTQLLLLLPAVMVSALYGGLFAGTVAALVGAIATVAFKMWGLPASVGTNFVSLLMYSIACAILMGLSLAQRNHRQQIIESAETLELKVKQRTADLELANREISEFCYSISHDMRAPMRSLVTSSRILQEELGNQVDSDARQRIQNIADNANQLASWVDDLLGYARLSNTDLKPEWVNVTAIADDICSLLRDHPWGYSSVSIQIQPNLVTTGDRRLVRDALWNVLENAFKYSKKNEPLVIEVSEFQTNRGLFLSVKDNGIGFEQQYSTRIFEPFQRLHREAEYAGSGIGLANVKRIVDRHGGEISAEGHPSLGATFYLRFGPGRTEGKVLLANP